MLINSYNTSICFKQFVLDSSYRFQHTALTSRLTVYILGLFWCFFFFFGESLLLITFNYNTLTDLIPSSFFVFTKSHVIFTTFSSSAALGDSIFFFIVFFSISAFGFLVNLRFSFSYRYVQLTAIIDLFVFLLIIFNFPVLFSAISTLLICRIVYRQFR